MGLSVAGALTGATWATGLGVLARGVRPQFQLIGADEWQIVLIEHGSARLILLLGHFTNDPSLGIDFLATSLRQNVDVIAGERKNLDLIDWQHPKWPRATRIVLGEDSQTSISGNKVVLSNTLRLTVGEWTLSLSQDVRNAWSGSEAPTWTWVANADCQGMVVTFANDLTIANAQRNITSALLVAPTTGANGLSDSGPQASVALNVDSVKGAAPEASEDSAFRLIRIFPDDIAAFRVVDGQLTVPEWATQR